MKPNEQTGLHQVTNGKTGVCRDCANRGRHGSDTWCGVQAKHVPRKGSCHQFTGKGKG